MAQKREKRQRMFIPLSVQWLPAWLQLTQNGAETARRERGWGANGRRGKVGKKEGQCDSSTEGKNSRRECIERESFSHVSGLPLTLALIFSLPQTHF